MSADFSDLNFDVIKDTYIGCFKKFLVIEGRARRREFWLFCLINAILGLIPVIGWVVGVVTCIPSFTVGIRRLHDINKSGKYMFLMLIPLGVALILMIGFIASLSYGGGAILVFLILILLASLAPAVILLIWAAKEGDKGSNNYGPDPKGASGKKAASTAKSKSKK